MEFNNFIEDYYKRFISVIQDFDKSSLLPVLDVFENIASSGGTLWVAGNGGSAAIGDHTACDTTKGTFVDGCPPIRTISLSSNSATLTALANDFSYDDIFQKQLTYYLNPNDAVLLISASGNSSNVVKACEYCNSVGIPTIAFVGFDGGELKRIAKHCVWIPIDNYGMSEDVHQSLMHVLTQYLYSKTLGNKINNKTVKN